ncbi:MAG: hypothetical protein ABIE36_03680 [Candidatus Diapherotrites archaeon]
MKTNYKKIRYIGKYLGIGVAIAYGLNFAGQEINYQLLKNNLNEVKKEHNQLFEENKELGTPNRDYSYWSSWETWGGTRREVSSMAKKHDNNTRKMIELEEKERLLEDKISDSKRKRFTIF